LYIGLFVFSVKGEPLQNGMFDINEIADLDSIPSADDADEEKSGRDGMFDLNDLVDLSSIPSSRDNEDQKADFKHKRQDADINIEDLVDWSSLSNLENHANSIDGDDVDKDDIPGDHLNPADFQAADTVVEKTFDEPGMPDPILSANLFEGDIANVNLEALQQSVQGKAGRNAIRDSWRKWPGGVIPYIISGRFNSHERSVIARAMKNYHEKTCIRFVPRTNEKGYINIMQGSGCSSSVGRTGRSQQVSLGNGCVYTGIVMHELMHATGFWHEQSRADRDKHITINWSNIQSGMEFNFLKYDLNKIDHLGAEYDTCSVMHYGSTAFAKSWGKKTIVPKHATKCKLGQRDGFSDTDIRKINTLYKCKGYPQVGGGSVTVVTTPKPTTKPWVKPSCEDTNKYCAYWATIDECKKNPSWMLVNCPVACDQCGHKCEDNNVHCQDWAQMGECSKNPEYMNIYCAKACKKCAGNCEDEKKDCKTWAKKGFCKSGKYVDYMNLRCKKSCKVC